MISCMEYMQNSHVVLAFFPMIHFAQPLPRYRSYLLALYDKPVLFVLPNHPGTSLLWPYNGGAGGVIMRVAMVEGSAWAPLKNMIRPERFAPHH